MKKTILLITLCWTSFMAYGQDRLSADMAIGLGVPYLELDGTDYFGYKPNLALTAGLGYQISPLFRLRGDLLYGSMNGNDSLTYFQSNIGEANLSLEINLVRLFDKEANFKFNLVGGTGIALLHSNLYNRIGRNRVQEIPTNRNGTYSIMWHTLGGANIGIPLSPKWDINVGYHHRFTQDQPWIDATNTGGNDSYGMIRLGFTYFLKHVTPKGKKEVDEQRYANLQSSRDSLEDQVAQQEDQEEKLSRLEMNVQEKDMLIANLQNTIDSLEEVKAQPVAQVEEMKDARSRGQAQPKTRDQSDLGKKQYRVIIGSVPTKSMAQRFMNNSKLDKSEMMTVYSADVDSYRIIYKSTDTYPAAKKAKMKVKRTIPDAWIAQF